MPPPNAYAGRSLTRRCADAGDVKQAASPTRAGERLAFPSPTPSLHLASFIVSFYSGIPCLRCGTATRVAATLFAVSLLYRGTDARRQRDTTQRLPLVCTWRADAWRAAGRDSCSNTPSACTCLGYPINNHTCAYFSHYHLQLRLGRHNIAARAALRTLCTHSLSTFRATSSGVVLRGRFNGSAARTGTRGGRTPLGAVWDAALMQHVTAPCLRCFFTLAMFSRISAFLLAFPIQTRHILGRRVTAPRRRRAGTSPPSRFSAADLWRLRAITHPRILSHTCQAFGLLHCITTTPS